MCPNYTDGAALPPYIMTDPGLIRKAKRETLYRLPEVNGNEGAV
jgi:hypothetical protein